jgi:hypothetical protein
VTTQKTFALDTKPGIQRDGTVIDMNYYTDGKWVRFQRGRPRKIAGYIQITDQLAGPCRGMYIDPKNGYTTIFSGYSDGLQSLVVNQYGVGTGITDLTISGIGSQPAFIKNANNMWQMDSMYDQQGTGNELLFAHPGQNLAAIDSQVNTHVLQGNAAGTVLNEVGIFIITGCTVSGGSLTTITLPTGGTSNSWVGVGQIVTGANIPTNPTYVTAVSGTTVTISANATNGTGLSFTFDNDIQVSGGLVVLHPYLFVYGNFGLIQNSSAANAQNWVGGTANKTYVASTKIVKGLPVRGGANAPSGLFWALDSLIRVSYVPTTITVGTTSSTFYWRYDIISSQTSILSSQCVIEYDGIFYWIGIDRFLMYGGTVKEVPNSFNQNYFFDNLNFAQRQKVWVQKIPRYGEIWWYYPKGTATECTDAIIYNIRENCWYDAGQANGARRCAGYYSQVFHYPVAAQWETTINGGIATGTITAAGTSYTNGTYSYKTLTALTGSGTGGTATIVVAGGVVTSVTINNRGKNYAVGDTVSASLPVGSGFVYTVSTLMNFAPVWQCEVGVDQVTNTTYNAIESFFETSDLGLVSGGPSEPTLTGVNRWLRLERVEPDFVMSGQMTLYITGRPYAQTQDKLSQAYVFDSNTGKIDMKEQRRELRLRFISNVAGGDYQLGKVILDADTGDVRGYG